MKYNVDKIFYQTDRASALNKYPDNENFKTINESYQPTILSLFDDETFEIGVIIGSKKSDLFYKVKPVKNHETNVPRTETVLSFKFYIIEIISPSYLKGTNKEQLEEYMCSPIKEGEYYGCQFVESQCSWRIGQPLSSIKDSQRFYKFYLAGHDSSVEIIPSANTVMGYTHNYPENISHLIDEFSYRNRWKFSSTKW